MRAVFGVLGVVMVVAAAGFAVAAALRGREADGPCTTTLAPGQDIGRALSDAPAGAILCLASGTHRPFAAIHPRAGVTLKGEGADRTVIQADGQNGATVTDADRFTLADLTVRGGSRAGIAMTRMRDLTVRGVRVEGAATGLYAEAVTAELTDVSVDGSTDFGLLLRRGSHITGHQVRVAKARGIGVGAVDTPGALDLADSEVVQAGGGRGEGMVLNGWEHFALRNVTVRGGDPAGIYVARARRLTLRDVRVEGAVFGLHLDENATGALEDVTLAGSTGVGLLVQRGGTITGAGVRVLDAAGTGVSLINGSGPVTLRDSEIGRVAAAGLFAGVAGCADLPAASLAVPECFYKDIESHIGSARVTLERVSLYETGGPCLVFFAGTEAKVRDSTLRRCELTGLFAWGAVADVANTLFEDNAEHALEYRAFPDPRGDVLRVASGTIEGSIVRGTRPLEGAILGDAGPGPVLGGGVLAQGAHLVLHGSEVSGNRDIGVAFINRSTGEVVDTRIQDNGNVGLCIPPDAGVTVRGTILIGNRSDNPNACR